MCRFKINQELKKIIALGVPQEDLEVHIKPGHFCIILQRQLSYVVEDGLISLPYRVLRMLADAP